MGNFINMLFPMLAVKLCNIYRRRLGIQTITLISISSEFERGV